MDQIAALIKPKTLVKDRRTQRGELLKDFFKEVNAGRVEGGFKPLSMGRLGVIFQGVPNDDLYAFLKECKKAKSFGAYFNYKMFPKKKI